MDPLSLLAVATTAYEAIKSGIEVGKEIEGMAQDLGELWESVAHLTSLAASPPKKFGSKKSIEAQAIEIYAAKAKAQEMALAARNAFIGQYGLAAWDSLQKLVIEMRKQREREERIRQEEWEETKYNIILIGGVVFIVLILAGFVYIAIRIAF